MNAENQFQRKKKRAKCKPQRTKDTPFQEQECIWVAWIDFSFEKIDGEYRLCWGSTLE